MPVCKCLCLLSFKAFHKKTELIGIALSTNESSLIFLDKKRSGSRVTATTRLLVWPHQRRVNAISENENNC